MSFYKNYLQHLCDSGRCSLAEAVEKTVNKLLPDYLNKFSYSSHDKGLLMGNVQSGKTSHMLGIVSAAADKGFSIFILLTTDNILLQQQTISRAKAELKDFCICDETEYPLFVSNNMKKPVMVVLKKNVSILRKWKNDLAGTGFVKGNPLFIVDDEADAASLNTLVNKGRMSGVHKALSEIEQTSGSSIYMQVTGTPQSLLLQTQESGWHPDFVHYFQPGTGYLGGDFFFKESENKSIILSDDSEFSNLQNTDEEIENCLKKAVCTHLVTSAEIFLKGGTVSNFLVHPSVKIAQHEYFASLIGEYLNEINLSDGVAKETLEEVYNDLKQSYSQISPFDEIYAKISTFLEEDKIKILVLNSKNGILPASEYENGVNVVVGGNTLGRGITFPKLQTIYYSRLVKNPQADTMWQHSRMFGYDRIPGLMRVFMPAILYKIFADINRTNDSLISQMLATTSADKIKLYYPPKIKPTRKNVLDNSKVAIISGGVNYFPFNPENPRFEELSSILSPYEDGEYSAHIGVIIRILEQIDSSSIDFIMADFISLLKAIQAEHPAYQVELIVRRGRNVSYGTGTLLSQTDRLLGDKFPNQVVLTMYQINGEHGWHQHDIWVPNIKFPVGVNYYTVRE